MKNKGILLIIIFVSPFCLVSAQDSLSVLKTFRQRNGNMSKVGYINSEGDTVIQPKFSGGDYFAKGQKYTKVSYEGFPGIINRRGEFIFYSKKYRYITGVGRDNMIRVRDLNGWTYLKLNGKPLFESTFKGVSEFSGDSALVLSDNDSLHIINLKGEIVRSLKYFPEAIKYSPKGTNWESIEFCKNIYPIKECRNLYEYATKQFLAKSSFPSSIQVGASDGESSEYLSHYVLSNGWIMIYKGYYESESITLRMNNVSIEQVLSIVLKFVGCYLTKLDIRENEILISGITDGTYIDYKIKDYGNGIIEINFYETT